MVEVLEVEQYLKAFIKRYMSVAIGLFVTSLLEGLFSRGCLHSAGGQWEISSSCFADPARSSSVHFCFGHLA